MAFSLAVFAQPHEQLKAFPVAKDGMTRFVIVLPHKDRREENGFKIELIPGKTMLTDDVNKMRWGMTVEPRPLKGWGYTYYEITGKDVVMSTRMAAPEGIEKQNGFVAGTPILIRYNSRLPIVVYAKKGYEIRYRIWAAAEPIDAAEG